MLVPNDQSSATCYTQADKIQMNFLRYLHMSQMDFLCLRIKKVILNNAPGLTLSSTSPGHGKHGDQHLEPHNNRIIKQRIIFTMIQMQCQRKEDLIPDVMIELMRRMLMIGSMAR